MGLPKTQTRFNSLRSIGNTLCYWLDWYSKRYFSPAWIWNMRRISSCLSGMSIHSFNRWLHDMVMPSWVLQMYLMRMRSSFRWSGALLYISSQAFINALGYGGGVIGFCTRHFLAVSFLFSLLSRISPFDSFHPFEV